LTPRAGALVLIVEGGKPRTRTVFDLTGIDAVTFGRASGGRGTTLTDAAGERRLLVALEDRRMSKVHAQLRGIAGSWSIEDAGSRNGTRVNGVDIQRGALRSGDLVEIGRSFLVFCDRAPPAAPEDQPLGLVTQNFGLGQTFVRLAEIARSAIPVLIHGDTGTGKELAARAIHELSARKGPLLAVNCGALPRALLESELFGHRKGAFSGALENRAGLVRAADKGTLFLDEIGDLPLDAQASLLRVLQEREVLPIGTDTPIPIDVRIVAATHRNLDAMVVRERFRADLLARLSGFAVRLPPLRERLEDLGTLLRTVIDKFAPARASALDISPAVVHSLHGHPWPDNIRGLEQVVTAALVLARGNAIELDHLPERLVRASPLVPSGRARRAPDERAELEALLAEHHGNVTAVAALMKTSRTHIHRLCQRYSIDLAAQRVKS
jgi:DNA-binding NtrC family response regulator